VHSAYPVAEKYFFEFWEVLNRWRYCTQSTI